MNSAPDLHDARSAPLTLREVTEPPAGFLTDQPLGGDFYRGAGRLEVPGFEFGYLIASQAGRDLAVAPFFTTKFKLNTLLDEGWLKSAIGNLGLNIACIGHPCAPFGQIEPASAVTPALLQALFDALSRKAPIVALKGFAADLPAPGFVRVPGLPVAQLALRPRFWESMSHHKRNFQRKRKAAQALNISVVPGLPEPLVDAVHQLYLNSYRKANVRFEQLSRAYFTSTAPLSHYLLAWLDGELVGFIQLIRKDQHMAAFYMGMNYAVDRKHGLYFAMMMAVVDEALAQGCSNVEFGETSYAFKRSLGCELADTWVYYRHRHPLINPLLARLGFLLAPSEKELR